MLRTFGRNLLLTGAEGAKRGTPYAVYGFLERECGVRCGKIKDTGVAFAGGIYGQGGGKGLAALSARIEDGGKGGAGGGRYHLYDLGTHELHDGVYVWFGTTGGVSPENVKAVYVDRVLFVRE